MVNVFQNIFAAIYCPPKDLHAEKKLIPKFNFFRILWDFEICQKWPKTLPELATMRYDDHVSRMMTFLYVRKGSIMLSKQTMLFSPIEMELFSVLFRPLEQRKDQ